MGSRKEEYTSGSLVKLQNQLAGALIGLARAADGCGNAFSHSGAECLLDGLSAVFSAGCGRERLTQLFLQVTDEKRKLAPDCFACTSPCGRTSDFDMDSLLFAKPEIRSLKVMLFYGIHCMAVYACQGAQKGFTDSGITDFFCRALFLIGMDGIEAERLYDLITEAGEIDLKCRDLWEKASCL